MNQNFELYKNVNFVVNLEARGIKGPALMFETSSNNEKVIDLYKKANLPVSYSLAQMFIIRCLMVQILLNLRMQDYQE